MGGGGKLLAVWYITVCARGFCVVRFGCFKHLLWEVGHKMLRSPEIPMMTWSWFMHNCQAGTRRDNNQGIIPHLGTTVTCHGSPFPNTPKKQKLQSAGRRHTALAVGTKTHKMSFRFILHGQIDIPFYFSKLAQIGFEVHF